MMLNYSDSVFLSLYLKVFSICAVLALISSNSRTALLSTSILLAVVMLLPIAGLNPPHVAIPPSGSLGARSEGPSGPVDLILLTAPCLGPSAVLLLPSLSPCLLSGEDEVLLAPG